MFSLLLFAQAQNAPAPPPPPAAFAGLFAMMLICFGVFFVIAMLPSIFFLLTLSKALNRCRPQCRTQEPGMVWLALVPLLGIVWIFINVVRVSESLRNEFRARRWHSRNEDYGYGIGIAYCALVVASIIPYIGVLFAIAGLVCWIIYWVKVANLSGELASGNRYEEDDDEDDYDDEDDRPRRRRRDDDDDEDDRDEGRKPWERRGR